MPHWTKIVIHDSYDRNSVLRRSNEIVEYHTGWKDLRAGEPLSEAVAKHLIEQGESDISRPWKDGGDHWHVEHREGKWQTLMIHSMTSNGCHVREGTFNRSAISVRIIHDLAADREALFERLAILCKFLMKTYKIPAENIITHHEISPDSDCPKAWFVVEAFRAYLKHFLSRQ